MANQITPNPSVPSQVVAQLKFPRFVNNLGIIPTSYKDSMSYYETLTWLCKFLEETVIPTVNENGEAVEELQRLYIELNSYVTNYFDNLDVQEEINNKLDDMVEAGTLQEIISSYLNSKAVFGFDTVSEMKNATNLINGSYARTLGFYERNDGGSALYKIRTVTNDDVIDNALIIPLNDQTNNLIAELVHDENINVLTIGCKGDDLNNDGKIISDLINNNSFEKLNLIFPTNKIFKGDISTNKKNIKFSGNGTIHGSISIESDTQVWNANVYFENITISNIENNSTNSSKNGVNLKSLYNVYFNSVKIEYSNRAINLIDNGNIQCGRILINNCVFSHNNYEVYNDNSITSTAGWQNSDIQFSNNQILNTQKTAIKLKNIDGFICKNNTFFFAGYTAQDQIKEYNIDLDHCTFTIIEGNNLFESGYDGIRLNKFQNTLVKGNHFAWSSQRQPGSCLNLIGNTSSDISNSLIEGNTFSSPSLYGINVNCFVRGLTISNNSFVFDSSNQYYYGSETIPLNSRKTIHVPSDYSESNILITNNNYYNWEDDINYTSQNTSIKSINNLSKYGIINRGSSYINITDDAWSQVILNLPSNEAFVRDRVYVPSSRTSNLSIHCIGTPIEGRIIQIFNFSDVEVRLSQTDYTKTQTGATVLIPKYGTVTIIAHDGLWLQIA